MMMSVVSMGIVTLTWVIFGFSWAFGDNGPVIGNFDYALFMDLDMKMWGDSGLPGLVFASFQMTFAIIVSDLSFRTFWLCLDCLLGTALQAPKHNCLALKLTSCSLPVWICALLETIMRMRGSPAFSKTAQHDAPGFGDHLGLLGGAHALQRLRSAPDTVVPADLRPALPLGVGPRRLDRRDGRSGLRGRHCSWVAAIRAEWQLFFVLLRLLPCGGFFA